MHYRSTRSAIRRRLWVTALFGLIIQSSTAAETNKISADSGKLRMLRGSDTSMTVQGNKATPLADRVASQFAPQFGVRNPHAELRVKKSRADNGRTHIRYQQLHQGLPVIGGELIANVDNLNQLTSMSGEVSKLNSIDITPAISAEQASQTAIAAVAKWHRLNKDQLIASPPELSIFDPSLIISAATATHVLAWQLTITPDSIAPIAEYILIDAKTGGILFHFNKIDTALARNTYTANNQLVLPGSLICQDLTTPCPGGDTDAQAAHDFAEDTYDFYFSNHGRDSIDGAGMRIVSTVHFGNAAGSTTPFQNAFWIGTTPFLGVSNQMVYGDGFATDDVVGHELTHGVTERTSNLFYYSESGAINESFSDLWGELIDQGNSAGTDTLDVKWKLGEDLPVGVIRDMKNPPLYDDPDRMQSSLFYIGADDNGGVHINSGVNNKAAYLMANGDIFNGQTVAGIGADKTAKIYYEAQTNLLTSGSDYLDLYNALIQACTTLTGTGDVLVADCTEVQKALTAVEMNLAPSTSYAPQATEICPVGVNVYDLFVDNFEANNLNKWNSANIVGTTNPWSTSVLNLTANSGNYTLISDGYDSNTNPVNPAADNDSTLTTGSAVRVPASATMYIHFDQAFYFETGTTEFYDGGVIEYSTNNGASWADAESLIESGRNYTGTLETYNPQPSRRAFAGFSNGYTSTRLDLTPLVGQFILFRFRSLADEAVSSAPWFIDNFRIYICAAKAPPIPNAGSDRDVNLSETVQLNGTASDPDGDAVTIAWTQTAGVPVTLTGTNSLTPTFTAQEVSSDLVFAMTVTDSDGNVETDTTTVSVHASLGSSSGCSFSANGRFDPLWIFLLLFLSGVHLRTRLQMVSGISKQHI